MDNEEEAKDLSLKNKKKADVNDNTIAKNDLASLLSRIAAIQGVAMPSHRFKISLFGNPNHESSDDVPLKIRIKELWLTIFSAGEIIETGKSIEKKDIPALWISQNEEQVMILKGLLSDGSASAELPDGSAYRLSSIELASGTILALRPKSESIRPSSQPRSAKDWFFYAIRKRKAPFIEAILGTFIISVLTLGVSFYTMQVYDRVVPTQSYSTLTVITIGVFIAVTMEFITKQLRSRTLDHACKLIDIELSSVFFGRMLSIRMDARPKTVGTFAAQIKQFELVRNFMTSSTLFVMADMPFVLFFIIIIWSVGGVIALVPLTMLPVSIMSGFYAKWKLANLSEEQLVESNQKNGLLVEAIDGIEAIKAVGGEWKMLEHWKHLTIKSADKELSIRSTSNLASSVTQSVQQLSYISLIAVGVYSIGTGQITMGALMACSIISNRALSPISQISGIIVQWQQAKAALKGLDEMMKLPSDRNEDDRVVVPETCTGKITLENVEFSYIEGNPVTHNLNLTVNPGERIAIVGPVGSGKSTLIKLLSGLYKPTKGKIFLDGLEMSQIAPEFLREAIGYLTQDIRLFNGSLRYNLTIGLPTPKDSEILAACNQTGLSPIIKGHPKGLELPIYEGGRGLSGGQRQLVGLTRMLIAKPQILLLDEPTASMDGDLEMKVIKNLVQSANPQSLLILSTHKLGLLNFVDRIIVMDKGRIVLDGPKKDVIQKISGQSKSA